MRRDQLEHAIRTACQIIGHPAVIIVGSQAILGSFGEDELGHRGEEHHPTGGPRSALAQVGDQCRSDVGRQGQQVDPVSFAVDPDGPINPVDVLEA